MDTAERMPLADCINTLHTLTRTFKAAADLEALFLTARDLAEQASAAAQRAAALDTAIADKETALLALGQRLAAQVQTVGEQGAELEASLSAAQARTAAALARFTEAQEGAERALRTLAADHARALADAEHAQAGRLRALADAEAAAALHLVNARHAEEARLTDTRAQRDTLRAQLDALRESMG